MVKLRRMLLPLEDHHLAALRESLARRDAETTASHIARILADRGRMPVTTTRVEGAVVELFEEEGDRAFDEMCFVLTGEHLEDGDRSWMDPDEYAVEVLTEHALDAVSALPAC